MVSNVDSPVNRLYYEFPNTVYTLWKCLIAKLLTHLQFFQDHLKSHTDGTIVPTVSQRMRNTKKECWLHEIYISEYPNIRFIYAKVNESNPEHKEDMNKQTVRHRIRHWSDTH